MAKLVRNGKTFGETYGVDTTPTQDSTNLITSGGAYNALTAKQDALVVSTNLDAVPTDGSNNPVTSDGVADALAGKQPTIDSNHKLSANLVQEESDRKFAYMDANGNIFIGGVQITQIIDKDSYDALVNKQNRIYLVYPTPTGGA